VPGAEAAREHDGGIPAAIQNAEKFADEVMTILREGERRAAA
jgi:hypothetical protein